MIIKKKSLIVAFVSSFVISLVLVLTLVGYVIYTELREEEYKNTYQHLLQKANAKTYSKHIEVTKLAAKIGSAGALKNKPILEGLFVNKGKKEIARVLIKVKFLDRDGAIIYEVMLDPQEPSLESSGPIQINIPYLFNSSRPAIKPDGFLPFKKVLSNCPKEIVMALEEGSDFAKGGVGAWSGKFDYEIVSIDF